MGIFNLSTLQKRILSAAVMIPAVIAVLYFGGWAFVGLIVVLASISLVEWVQLSFKCKPFIRNIYLFSGILYVISSFVCCYVIFAHFGLWVAVWFLLMVWGCDIGAYFFGKLIGGAKMAKTISPNKTWAGFFGGLFVSGMIGLAGHLFFEVIEIVHLLGYFSLGVLLAAAGQGGDLVVSALKRKAGVKDTGNIIPGHGGLLDRIDSMLLAAPVFVLVVKYWVSHGL